MEENKSKFSGLRKLFFTEEYLESTAEKPAADSTIQKGNTEQAKNTASPQYNYTSSNEESAAILEKIYKYLDSINDPQIDFVEVWDSMDAMGGVSEINLKATFAAMKIASKGSLTKELILSSGQGYLTKINGQISSDLNHKATEISELEKKRKDEGAYLNSKKTEIEENIARLQTELAQTKTLLQDLNMKYEPKIKEINQKILAGQDANKRITEEFNQIISLVNKSL